LEHEYELARDLDWSLIARPLVLERHSGTLALVLEQGPTATLASRLGAPMGVRSFLRIAISINSVLAELHRRPTCSIRTTLDHLHILLNYEWDSRALPSLVLVGLPDLLDRLGMRRNRSPSSRLRRRLRIDPFTPADTAEYIAMRLHRVGCDRDLFASDAIAMIHEAALGDMRDADGLATAALREAARNKRKLVERDAVTRIIEAHIHGDADHGR
jgi:hypothetical protein